MANPEKEELFKYIPCNFLEDILSRLDAKSLKRCECVSKSWLSLLRTPHFMNLHLRRQPTRVVFLGEKVRSFGYHLSICNGESFVEISEQNFPLYEKNQPPVLVIVGSANGVLCIYDLMDELVYLWNPAIHESKELPHFPQLGDHCELGLGYDPLTSDFKVVKVSYLDENGVRNTDKLFKEGSQIGIYSLKSNSWKTMAMPDIFSEFESSTAILAFHSYLGGSVVVNDCIHWMIRFGNNTTDSRQLSLGIVAFHISMEKFKLIKLPQIVRGHNVMILASFSGCLSFFTLQEVQVVEIWVMKNHGDSDSWFKYLSINLLVLFPSTSPQYLSFILKDLLSNGNLVIYCTNTGHWYWYDTKNNRLEEMGKDVLDLTTYVESTFKLEG